ncbi:hypothetical protein BGZ65_002880 [Modicella reniformis]|uniref:Myb-like domain-containing protein n=1 Tax=Modicella reniformis TaxID=1440133 RepID=A0A9P6STT6_9FUNG|nr:hypothetical protein BGZ65_002880 [Modicella reniformis]
MIILRPALEKGWVPPEVEDQERLKQLVQKAKTIAQLKMTDTDSKAAAERNSALEEETKGSKRTKWSPDMDRIIVDMVDAGTSWIAIGLTLDRPYASCYSRYYSTLDPILKEPWSLDIIRQVDEWVMLGLCWKSIAKKLDMRPLTCKSKWVSLSRFDSPAKSGTSHPDSKDESSTVVTGSKSESKSKSKVKRIAFSKEESKTILKFVEQHGPDNWDQILKDFQARFIHSSSPTITLRRSQHNANQRIRGITTSMLRHQHSRLARASLQWTFDQETVLIQQVIKHGTEGHWSETAKLIDSHSPEECRSHWKQLDMPISSNSIKWTKTEKGTFWTLWRELGPNFERLSKLCGGNHSAADCQSYFEDATQGFPDPEEHPEEFGRCMEELQSALPTQQTKYNFTKPRSLRLQSFMRSCGYGYGYGKQEDHLSMVSGTWIYIANRVQRGLAPISCVEHWLYLHKNMDVIHGPLEKDETIIKSINPNSWSHDELKLLDQGIRELGANWGDIQQKFLPWRTSRSLRQRWMLMSDRSTKVTEDEYYTILAAGERSSEIDYNALAEKMAGWNQSPCRRVFETSYKHFLVTTVWLPEEDRLLIEKTLELNGHWKAIVKHFDGIQPAMAPLYAETMALFGPDDNPPMRRQKTAWQCRLRWCELVAPLMPTEQIWFFGQRSLVLKLSRQLVKRSRKHRS